MSDKDIVKCAECGKEIDLKEWKLRSIFASFTIECPHCHKSVRIVKEEPEIDYDLEVEQQYRDKERKDADMS